MTTGERLSPGEGRHRHAQAGPVGERDPVCGMTVDPATAGHHSRHGGKTYYFCGSRCRERFEADPARYLAPAPLPTAAAGTGPWTCPMHPQIVRDAAGSCPICGMALEPMTPMAGGEANPELRDMTRRFWVGVALSAPLLALVMSEHAVHLLSPAASVWAQFALATPVVLWAGAPVFPPRLGIGAQPPAQHVHADLARRRHRLSLQPGRGGIPADLPGLVPDSAWRGADLFRNRRRSS